MNALRQPALCLVAGTLLLSAGANAGMIITPTFTTAFVTDFGTNATAAEASWIAAANAFSANFSDAIHVNITVDAVADTSVFGQSSTSILSETYSNLRAKVVADAKTADDATAIGTGGSLPVSDPTGGTETWYVTRSQAKALGLIADDLSNDGTTKFGAGNSFTFSGSIAAGTYDFQGIAEHEISEVLGRIGLKSSSEVTLLDAFSFSGPGTRNLSGGADSFSIDGGTTLLKTYNNPGSNGLDSRDWASGTNDSFNQYSGSGVVNGLSTVDLQEMDVIGYDRITTPEPSTSILLTTALIAGYALRRRRRVQGNR